MTQRPIALLAILLFAGLLARAAWPPDETRNADVARAIAAGDGWLVPMLHGTMYREKPPVFFWLSAAVVRLGAPVQAAPRAVAGAAALATLLLLPAIAAALGLPRAAATRAGWVLAASPLFLVYAQIGMVDTTATACVTAAIAAKLARADRAGGARALLVALEGVALAAALLTKGPVLLLFPIGLRLGAALARERSPASADRSDLAAFGLALGIGGAWLLAAANVAGSQYVQAIGPRQVFRRVTGRAPHLRPPGFLIGVTLLGLLPWLLLGAPLGRLRSRWREAGSARPGASQAALLGWILLPALLLSLLRTQQPHYLLPALPAAALLLGQAVDRPERWATRGTAALALLVSGVLLLHAIAAPLFPDAPAELASATDLATRAVAALAATLLLALVLLPAAARLAPWVRAAIGMGILAVCVLFALARLDAWMLPRALLASGAVVRADRLAAPQNVRSTVRILSGRSEVDKSVRKRIRAWLAEGPGRVALMWESEYLRLESEASVAGRESDVIEIGRGTLRGRSLVAVRAAPTPATEPDRIR
ncbi:MAG TPA: phospholipid carrier-dependent glycosyltransferase [Myxococcota bacterium]